MPQPTHKTAGIGDAITNTAITGGGAAVGGLTGLGVGTAAGGLGGASLAVLLAKLRHGNNRQAAIKYLNESMPGMTEAGSLLGAGVGGLTGATIGGTLGSRLANATQRAADRKHDKTPRAVYLAPPPNYVPPHSLQSAVKMGAVNEDPLLKSIMKNTKDKGQAIAIAKSKGWVKQEGKHLGLTSKGKKPAEKAASKPKGKMASSIEIDELTQWAAEETLNDRSKVAFWGSAARLLGKGLWGGTKLVGKGIAAPTRMAMKVKNPAGRAAATSTAVAGTGAGLLGTGSAAKAWMDSNTSRQPMEKRQYNGLATGYDNPATLTPSQAADAYGDFTGGSASGGFANMLAAPLAVPYRAVRSRLDPDYAAYRQALGEARQLTPEAMSSTMMRRVRHSPQSEMAFENSLAMQRNQRRRDLVKRIMAINATQGRIARTPDNKLPGGREQLLNVGEQKARLLREKLLEMMNMSGGLRR